MKRAVIDVYGYVQGVGFRYYVETKAYKHDIKGYVQNMPKGHVHIEAEGDEEKLNKFIEEIKDVHTPIKIDNIQVNFSEELVGYESFKIIMGDVAEEIMRGFQTGYVYIKQLGDDIKGEFFSLRSEIRSEFSNLRGDVGGLKDEIQLLRGETKKVGEEVSNLRGDVGGLKDEIQLLRGETKKVGEEVSNLRGDTRNFKDEIKLLREETRNNFNSIVERYGQISSELIKTREELRRAIDRLSDLIDILIKELSSKK